MRLGFPPDPFEKTRHMKIDSIEATAIEIPLPRQFSGSVYAMTTRCAIVTRLRTMDGLEALVYNGGNGISMAVASMLSIFICGVFLNGSGGKPSLSAEPGGSHERSQPA